MTYDESRGTVCVSVVNIPIVNESLNGGSPFLSSQAIQSVNGLTGLGEEGR